MTRSVVESTDGTVTENMPGKVLLKTPIGGRRILAKLSGIQLPRIC